MEYTSKVFVDFIKKLIVLDKEFKSVLDISKRVVQDRAAGETSEWNATKTTLINVSGTYKAKVGNALADENKTISNIINNDISNKKTKFDKLQKCKEALATVISAEKSISDKEEYQKSSISEVSVDLKTAEDVVSAAFEFSGLANEINYASKTGKKKEFSVKAAQLYSMCRIAEKLLNEEIANLRSQLVSNKDALHTSYENTGTDIYNRINSEWNTHISKVQELVKSLSEKRKESKNKTKEVRQTSKETKEARINKLINDFFANFSPKDFLDEYMKIYSAEPLFEDYKCAENMPKSIYISTLEYNVNELGLCEYTKEFLEKYYYFMCRDGKLVIPYCAQFSSEFNYIFKFNGEGRQKVVQDACDMGMRLFMMLPPGKVNFTFIDPVTLGESFATFTRLVDVDDRTSEIINGKIWSSPSDIEDKLRIMTNHISNVTQRCLQGKYNNIFEYNKVAEQNAEAYQIIMLMDYPAGLTDQSLKLLEQIATSGPKCGVFTVIYRNESQYKKISERSYPLISNIESNFKTFNYSNGANTIKCSDEAIKNQLLTWKGVSIPEGDKLNTIIATLKKGIKNAEKVVIGIEKVDNAESVDTTKDGIRIPIGIHGANEVQYLTLGVGGSHHALIAGVAGSGKSSLLHTIILRTLMQYSPEELVIYLVDFKRGVEFKIYADFELPSFKVVAIESEREFGYNILTALEREQKIRADLFKKSHVDKIEEYREQGKKMPRVLVIMDEFHELFSNANDEFAKKSAIIMERIVRQGRAFGVHMILASQSYSNITGIDRAVFDQMAVRIVLKCSKADANLLLDNGSTEIDQISIDDPGRAVYNSEAGNKEYNSHFRVAYIEPDKHRNMLSEISAKTRSFVNKQQPTRILLSNIEDNNYSIFNQFTNYDASEYKDVGRLYIGEPLSVSNNMSMDFARSEYSNLLMIGDDTEKARSMFAFSILSLCINYWIKNKKVPDEPFIYLYNCKPLDDSYFKDTPQLLSEYLPQYVKYVSRIDSSDIQNVVSEMYDVTTGSESNTDKYLFVFGYQRAEDLKSDIKLSQSDDIDNLFNIMPTTTNKANVSIKDMFRTLIKEGPTKGMHTIIWQDSFNALYQDDKDIMSYFAMKIAFDMSQEEFSRFVSANDVGLMSENNAIYYNRARDNQKFRPYQAPDEEWLKSISDKLK